MKVFLNSESYDAEDKALLYHLLNDHGFASKTGIAVAVNNQVIRKQDWEQHTLNENDIVLVISATKGG